MDSESSMRLEISTSCSRVSSGTWPHLLEVHADGVVEDVEAATGFAFLVVVLVLLLVVVLLVFLVVGFGVRLLFLLEVLVAVNIRGFDDVELHRAQAGLDGFDQVGIVDAVGQGLVEVVPSEVALFLGELDEFANFLLRLVGLGLDLRRGRMDHRFVLGRLGLLGSRWIPRGNGQGFSP